MSLHEQQLCRSMTSSYFEMSEFSFADSSVHPPDPRALNETPSGIDDHHHHHTAIAVTALLKGSCMLTIIVLTIFGNLLVMVSVLRSTKLRTLTNSFVVSLACADLMVAVLVMPFNAVQEIAGRWYFGRTACDLFNANDVQFSTASLLHLCCISVDRYIAITDPFHYSTRMTPTRALWMLVSIWTSSALLSHVPIHLGWYSPSEEEEGEVPAAAVAGAVASPQRQDQDGGVGGGGFSVCHFKVNSVYGLVSATVSFWTPAAVMIVAYANIFREAKKQEERIYSLTYSVGRCMVAMNEVRYLAVSGHTTAAAAAATAAGAAGAVGPSSSSARQERHKLKSEHKAARTLGFVMGAFVVCWLPFFSWYLTTSLCSQSCWTPPELIPVLFWIGYFNSALNPFIYAFFNRDFRDAFKKVLCCSGGGRSFHSQQRPKVV